MHREIVNWRMLNSQFWWRAKRRTSLPRDDQAHIFQSEQQNNVVYVSLVAVRQRKNGRRNDSYCIEEFVIPLHLASWIRIAVGAPVQTILGPLFFFFFSERWQGNYSSHSKQKKKKETSAKEMSREILFLVLTAHYYVRRVSSSQSVCRLLWRAKLLTFFDCDGFHCPLLLASPFSPFLEFHLVSMSSPGFFKKEIK